MDDGGNAFPIPEDESNVRSDGMSLRDYFAAAALKGMLASCMIEPDTKDHEAAERAYSIADAMLRKRGSRDW